MAEEALVRRDQQKWSQGLFSCKGTCGEICSSCFCPCLVSAYSRTLLDGSDFWVNACLAGMPAHRWLIRSAYNIEGTACQDIYISGCCMPCTANQMLQTMRTNDRIPYAGRDYNSGVFMNGALQVLTLTLHLFTRLLLQNGHHSNYSPRPFFSPLGYLPHIYLMPSTTFALKNRAPSWSVSTSPCACNAPAHPQLKLPLACHAA